jgi:hypothetical protein
MSTDTMSTNNDFYSKTVEGVDVLQKQTKSLAESIGGIVVIFLGIIGLVYMITELYTVYKIHQIATWPIIHEGGQIVNVVAETSTETNTYSLILLGRSQTQYFYRTRASFVYRVGNTNYISNRISYDESWSDNPAIPDLEKSILKPGAKVDIRINPKNPNEAYIFNKPYQSYGTLFVSIALTVVGSLYATTLL